MLPLEVAYPVCVLELNIELFLYPGVTISHSQMMSEVNSCILNNIEYSYALLYVSLTF